MIYALTPYLGDRALALFILLVFCPFMALASIPKRPRCRHCGTRFAPLGEFCSASDPRDPDLHDFAPDPSPVGPYRGERKA